MIGRTTCKFPNTNSQFFFLGRNRIIGVLQVVLFSLFFQGLWGQNPGLIAPQYEWLNQVDLASAGLSTPENIIISVATDPEGNVYTLSFGKGVAKRNAEGVLINANFIPASRLDNPLDMAIDENGFIYIADFLAEGDWQDNGKIKIFSPQGAFLPGRTILTSYFRPMGLDVDETNVYVAEFNDGKKGPESTPSSRLRIYDKNNNTAPALRTNNQVTVPYRIAVNSEKNIYVSQAGNNNPEVRIYNSSLVYENSLPGMVSPGSIVIDKFDYIHVIEYGSNIDFSEFVYLEELSTTRILEIAGDVNRGIDRNEFFIKIFNKDRTQIRTIVNNIDFPLDITFNNCDKMYVNNSKIFGVPIFGTFIPSRFDFYLEIFKRTPSFDTQKPLLSCPANISVTAATGATSAVVNYTPPTPTDNCSTPVLIRDGPPPGSNFPIGTTPITYTAIDDAENISTCSFTVTVSPAEEEPEPDFQCNTPENLILQLNNNCEFTSPDYYSYITNLSGFENSPFIVSSEEIDNNVLNINFMVYDGENGVLVGECSFTAILEDNIAPTIDCSVPTPLASDEQGRYFIPNYSSRVADNCDENPEIIQDPLPGTEVFSDTEVKITATDVSTNSNSCTFLVELDEEPFTFECSDLNDFFNESCEFVVPNYTLALQEQFPQATFSQIPPARSIVFQSTNIEISGSRNGDSASCVFLVIIGDNSKPQIECPNPQTESFDPEEGFIVPDYRDEVTLSDNCAPGEQLKNNLVQTPAAGSVIYASQSISLYVTDDAGNDASCNFQLTLVEEEEPGPSFQLQCIESYTVELENNSIRIPTSQFVEGDLSGIEFTIAEQFFGCADIGVNTITIEATKVSTGEKSSCNVQVEVIDVGKPIMVCYAEDQPRYFIEGENYILEHVFENRFSDACTPKEELIWEQNPPVGTVWDEPGTYPVSITVTDNNNNVGTCTVNIILEKVTSAPPTFSCTNSSIDLNPDSNCQYTVGEYTNRVSNFQNFTSQSVEQNIPEGTVITEDTLIILNVFDSGELAGTCEFNLILEDNSPLQITCPSNKNERFNPNTGFTIPDYTQEATVTDNCGDVTITQTPPIGAVVNGNTRVTLTATDFAGNETSCEFTVLLSENGALNIACPRDQEESLGEDCIFILGDYRDEASISKPGAEIVQIPAPGTPIAGTRQLTLRATLDGEINECVFMVNIRDNTPPVARCVGTYQVWLDQNGTASLEASAIDQGSLDNCSEVSLSLNQSVFTTTDIGENIITLSVRDADGNISQCETLVTVNPYEEGTHPEITCRSEVILDLDETGNANLSASDLYIGNGDNINFSISKENFNCSNIGSNTVTLSWSGNGQNGFCSVNVEVRDVLPPVVRTRNISVFLNEQGQTTINTQLINDGTIDNCGEASLSLDVNRFTCKDLGDNIVQLIATDQYGNTATASAIVTVTGNCDEPPPPVGDKVDYIVIYPNPSHGPIQIARPPGVVIQRIEVFDFRGRFLLANDFPENTAAYQMDLTGLQQAVYVLNIITSTGNIIRRVIIN